MDEELADLVKWYRVNQPTEIGVSRISRCGTNSDRILLQLFERFESFVRLLDRTAFVPNQGGEEDV